MEKNKLKKVTITTVAAHANVSIKTVSRVLNKETPMRDSTRDRVLNVIDSLGYKPSLAAVALAGRQSKLIGLVYSNRSASYVMSIQNGVLRACSEEEYNLVIHPCDADSDSIIYEIVSLAKNSNLDGVLLIPPLCDKENLVEALIENEINVVTLSPAKQNKSVASVSCQDKIAVEAVIKLLIESGHSNIGFIKGDIGQGATEQRFLGYKKSILDSGLTINQDLIQQGDFSFESGKQQGLKLLNLVPRPTAIFASNDYMAAGVISSAFDLGIKIPEELSVIGFDDAPVSRQISPLISTVKQPIEKMAEAATKLLVSKSKNPDIKLKQIEFKAELLFRESHK